jgi:hypothetical protein
MSIEEKIEILEDNGIEHYVDANGELMALYKMSTFAGDDCSEWLNADELVNHLK